MYYNKKKARLNAISRAYTAKNRQLYHEFIDVFIKNNINYNYDYKDGYYYITNNNEIIKTYKSLYGVYSYFKKKLNQIINDSYNKEQGK